MYRKIFCHHCCSSSSCGSASHVASLIESSLQGANQHEHCYAEQDQHPHQHGDLQAAESHHGAEPSVPGCLQSIKMGTL